MVDGAVSLEDVELADVYNIYINHIPELLANV
jgi:hypothetical protein